MGNGLRCDVWKLRCFELATTSWRASEVKQPQVGDSPSMFTCCSWKVKDILAHGKTV